MKNQTQINIDLELFKHIESGRIDFDETPNTILKRLLGLKLSHNTTNSVNIDILPTIKSESTNKVRMYFKGVPFPEGLQLRKILRGELLTAKVHDGRILFNGNYYNSPSGAGIAASNTSVNGWIFWEYYDEDKGRWFVLDELRRINNVK